ncbi:MAG: leucine-rich repeat domain-containing protein [Muribaculaceae bacterium]|nr:leucine-rich repeat domain-containing protein [Muribaculaceae bacterium]
MNKYRVVFNLSAEDPRYRHSYFELGQNKASATFDAASRETAINLFLEYINNVNEWCGINNLSPITNENIITIDLYWESKNDSMSYWLCEDGTAELNGMNVSDRSSFTELIIPDTVMANGMQYKITSIGTAAFKDFECLTRIQFPKWLTSIGKEAFSNCAIEEVEIYNVVTFGKYAFYCKSLRRVFVRTSMSIENTLEAFGLGTYHTPDLPDLEDITIYSTNIEQYTFFVGDFYDVFGFFEDDTVERHITLISDGPISLDPANFREVERCPLLKVSFLRKGSNDKMELSFNPSSLSTDGYYLPLVRFIPQNNYSENLELDIDQVVDFSDFDIE